MPKIGFDYFAQQDPEARAVIDNRGRTWSRGELYRTANRISRALLARGLNPGDVVAIVLPNCIEYFAVYLAATQIGLYVVPINWRLTQAEVEYLLSNSEARAVFTHERLAALMQSLSAAACSSLRARVSLGAFEGFVSLEQFTDGFSAAPIEHPQLGRMMMYTSATTGRPKAVSLPLADAAVALERQIGLHQACGLRLGEEVHLCSSTLYHAGPLDFAITALHMGHLVILVERWEPELLLQLVQRYRVTTAFMVPTMFVRLLKLPEEQRRMYDVSSVRFVVHTAAPCPTETKRQMLEWWGPVLHDGYGAAEGVGTRSSPEDWLKYPGTVGRPIPGSKICILDDEGRPLAPGQVGTVYLTRYHGDRFEYKGDPEKTRAAYRGEFFTVGDMGYVNDEGYLFLCDRKIDMIISAGTNIYPAEIEQVLVQHRAVMDCAVFGIPDDVLGEIALALVQPAPGVEPDAALAAELMQHLRERMAVTKLPRRLEFASELPRDPNGKLYKRRLREPYWSGRERRI